MEVVGKGTVTVMSHGRNKDDVFQVALNEVFHVPALSSTILVSIGQLCQVKGISFFDPPHPQQVRHHPPCPRLPAQPLGAQLHPSPGRVPQSRRQAL
jgi:hypothetical protein